MSQILGQCVGLLSGKSWQSLRLQMEVPFCHVAIMNEAPVIRKQTQQYVGHLRDSGGFRNGTFDPAKDLSFYPFLVVATLMYGELDAADIQWLKSIAPVRQKLFTFVIQGGTARFSISRHFPTIANRLLADFQGEWLCFNQSIYEKSKSRDMAAPMAKWWEGSIEGKMDQTQVNIVPLSPVPRQTITRKSCCTH
jgi:hypothetical protein